MKRKRIILLLIVTFLFITACTVERPEGDYTKVTEIPYGDDPLEAYDVFYQEDVTDAPIVFVVHGGGPDIGKKENVLARRHIYTDLGYVVVLPNYRYGDDAEVSTVHDVYCAVATFAAEAEKYGGDPDKIILHGFSAGGYRSSFIYFRQEHNWIKGCDVQDEDFTIKGFVSESSFSLGAEIPEGQEIELERGDTQIVGPTELFELDFVLSQIEERADGTPEDLNSLPNGAINYIDPNDPHALVLYGTADPNIEEKPGYLRYIEKLEENIEVEVHIEEGAEHHMGIHLRPELEAKVQLYVESVVNDDPFPF